MRATPIRGLIGIGTSQEMRCVATVEERSHRSPLVLTHDGRDTMNTTLEPCFNLWLFVDPLTGVVQTGAAKAYALHGTEQECKDLLQRLAPTD